MIKILAQNALWFDGVDFLLRDTLNNGFAKDIVFEANPNPNTIIEPTFKLSREATQELMDNLWQCGFRPSEGTGSAGALRATENHLADMRKLVFQLMGKNE